MSKPENYLFHSFDLPGDFTFTNSRFLFNSAQHLRWQCAKNWRIYETLESDTRAVKARIAFHIHGDLAASPFRAPFGFLEIAKEVSEDELVHFFLLIETDLKNRGVKRIQLKSYPEAYDKNLAKAEVALKKLKYLVTQEVSSVIPVDQKHFEKKIKISERQKLRKAERLFLFERVNVAHLKEIYAFIEQCRNEREQHLSMRFSELKKTISVFPKNFFLYRVYDTNGIAAAAVVIKVSSEILYTFYYAHARKFDKVSPVVFLISGIYELAQVQGIAMIDLGTSMLNGKVNRSLLHFKKSIGGQNSRKLIFEKALV